MFTKKIIFILVLVFVLLVAAGIGLGMYLKGMTGESAQLSPYSAVYLVTGDIYFGELHMSPWPTLKNVWFLQRSQDAQGQPQFSIAPIGSTFWAPTDLIQLNPNQIVFSTRLRAESQVAQCIANPQACAQRAQSQPSSLQGLLPSNAASELKGSSSPPPGR